MIWHLEQHAVDVFLIPLVALFFTSYITPPCQCGLACLNNPCVHGVCLDDLNTTYSCYCIDGYTGVQCQTNWDECWSNPCKNGGICIDGVAIYNCSCPSGYVGDECEDDVDECQSNPCQNNGTCIDAPNGYVCHCLPGFSGSYCELDVAVCNTTAETRCLNGGICVEGPGYSFSCRCLPGWTGFVCNIDTDECLSAPCKNGAMCIDLHADYACACTFSFTGRNCDEDILVCDNNPCKNGALCLMEEDHPTCYCVPDYHGDRCQFKYDECQLSPRCMNGGTCIDGVDDFTCSCPPNRSGFFCELLFISNVTTEISEITITLPSTDRISSEFTSILTTDLYTISTSTFSIDSTTLEETSSEFVTHLSTETVERTTGMEYSKTDSSSTDSTPTSIITTSDQIASTTTEISSIVDTTIDGEISSPSTEYIEGRTFEETTEINFTTTESTTFTSRTLQDTSTTEYSTTNAYTTAGSTFGITTDKITSTTESVYLPTDIITSTTEYNTIPSGIVITEYNNFTSINEEHSSATYSYVDTSTQSITIATSVTTIPITVSSTEGLYNVTSESVLTSFFTESPVTETISSLETSTDVEELNTTSTDITTAPETIYIDCTKTSNRCQNGGTCVYVQQGYKCICPFNAEGPTCNISLGIQHAAFNGKSYLSHHLHENQTMLVEFDVKTLSTAGLIFYLSVYNAYMILYIDNGYLKFKFSCGFQTMLLSELEKPINNGYNLHLLAELWFSDNFTTCNASIRANHTLSMTGNQLASIDKLNKFNSWLYLGNIPFDHLREEFNVIGFIGCMENLKIGNISLQIFQNADDGFEITECSSLACLSNPCKNGGQCMEKGNEWSCTCKYGFSGKMCQTFICENNPCQFGGTCLPYMGSGYICLCPLGKNGHYCENDIDIIRPNFSSSVHGFSSYIAYPLPAGGVADNLEISFTIAPTTIDQIALLLYLGEESSYNHPYLQGSQNLYSSSVDHLAVSFVKGYIMLTWNLGGGARRIFTNRPLSLKELNRDEFKIEIGRQGRRSWLFIEGFGNVTGRSPGRYGRLDVQPLLYFGGHSSRYFETLPHDLPLHTGFAGCIYDIVLRSGQLTIPLHGTKYSTGRAISQCGTTVCHPASCQHNGACLYHGGTFTCLCQHGHYGPLCSFDYNPCDYFMHKCVDPSVCVPLIHGYECDCQLGRSGRYCEKEADLLDIKFTGIRSYLLLQPVLFQSNNIHFEFELKPYTVNGLIMYFGRKDSFVSISIRSGLLEIRIRTGYRKKKHIDMFILSSNTLLIINKWNKIKFGIYGRRVYLFVDNVVNTGIVDNINTLMDITGDKIYLGGLPDLSKLPSTVQFPRPVPYHGCLRQLSVNSYQIPFNTSSIRSARNLADCIVPGCEPDYCRNGGRCTLDVRDQPQCACVLPASGKRCELVAQCSDGYPCKNGGKCNGARCSCRVGWIGVFCERSIIVKQPKFIGTSYLHVKKTINDRKRGVGEIADGLYFNFSTVYKNSMILSFNKNDYEYLLIALQNGRLKLFLLGEREHHQDMPYSMDLADGLWHTVELTFTPLQLFIDNNELEIQLIIDKHFPSADYNIYLGAIPNEAKRNVKVSVFNVISSNFSGCMDSFRTSKKIVQSNFNLLDGEDISNC